ncbi:hypothetical protein L195_g046528, partial [Trifolium pratense]
MAHGIITSVTHGAMS